MIRADVVTVDGDDDAFGARRTLGRRERRDQRGPNGVPIRHVAAAQRSKGNGRMADAGDPEPAPTPLYLHPGTHPNPARRLGPLGGRARSYPASGGVRGWAPRRVGLATDHRARRLRPPVPRVRADSRRFRNYSVGIL